MGDAAGHEAEEKEICILLRTSKGGGGKRRRLWGRKHFLN